MQIIFSFVICLLATTIGGISGVGGGVIIKPVLDATSGLAVSTVSFLSSCTVLAMSITTMLRNRNSTVKVETVRGTALALGGAVGGIIGKLLFDLAVATGGTLVSVLQQVLMIVLTLGVLVYTCNRHRIRTKNVQNFLFCTLIGLIMGIISSFLGIGGGPINLVVLFYFFSMDTKTAALNSLYVILFSQCASLLNTLTTGKVPPFQWSMMLVMVIGGIVGGLLGRSFSLRMSTKRIDQLFIVLLIVITLISCYNLLCVL